MPVLKALKVGLVIERANRKNLVALVAVAIIVFGFMFYINAQALGNQLVEKKGDYYSAQAILSKFQVKDASETGDGSELYKNLTKQKSNIALQIATLTLDKQTMYYETSLKLAELREEAFELEGYENVAELLPSKLQNSMDYLYFKRMNDEGKDTISDLFQYMPFLLFFFIHVGAGWYIFISFHTSSILLDDFEHSSIIQGFPIRFDHYILSKCIITFLSIVTSILLIFICAIPLWILNGLGNPLEPVAIYLGNATLISTIQYIAMSVGYMILISIFVMLLSIILNVLLKNMYLTLFVHFILFFLPMIFPSLISLIPYNPFNFMNFNDILRGLPVDLAKPVDITMNSGLIIMSISIILMLFVIKTFFSTGKIKRA
ncbi:ABC transporter [Lysinibacillus xylanilyticus]|uniref:ABC transporter n=1 Tax=Lysinibacillus xylanilyticus TaxID=582475 RepID=A0ABT4ET58_9BACI|nr:ABC transporter [Lysinibacillus xylanilyticus]MCY9548864.1 ABC transporter [Lysinibacillus xylanilyticus]